MLFNLLEAEFYFICKKGFIKLPCKHVVDLRVAMGRAHLPDIKGRSDRGDGVIALVTMTFHSLKFCCDS